MRALARLEIREYYELRSLKLSGLRGLVSLKLKHVALDSLSLQGLESLKVLSIKSLHITAIECMECVARTLTVVKIRTCSRMQRFEVRSFRKLREVRIRMQENSAPLFAWSVVRMVPYMQYVMKIQILDVPDDTTIHALVDAFRQCPPRSADSVELDRQFVTCWQDHPSYQGRRPEDTDYWLAQPRPAIVSHLVGVFAEWRHAKEDMIIAFIMSQHRRLRGRSPVVALDDGLLKMIMDIEFVAWTLNS